MFRFSLRIPQGLHQLIKQLASTEQRSINDQIIMMLREGVERRGLKVDEKAKQPQPPA